LKPWSGSDQACPRTKKIDQLFKSLDADHNGLLSAEELASGLRHLGVPCGRNQVQGLLRKADLDKDGTLSQDEFRKFVRIRFVEIELTWQDMGLGVAGSHGAVSSSQVRKGINRAGMRISDAELRSFVAKLDRNSDGSVSFAEFRYCLMLLPDVNPEAVLDSYLHDAATLDTGNAYDRMRDVKHDPNTDSVDTIASKLVVGGVAGAISRTFTAPLDRVRALMQAAAPGAARRGVLATATDIWCENGARAFLRGNGTNCLKIAPEVSAKFFLFEDFKRRVANDPDNVTAAERFASGGAAGACASALIYPLEIVKTRLAVSAPGTYTGIPDCLWKVWRNESFLALYKGIGTSMVGLVPYAGIDLAVMSLVKDATTTHFHARQTEPGAVALLSCGMISSTVAMSCTYPMNLIRTRLQASGMPGAPAYIGPLDCARRTVQSDGLFGLYRGILPNMLKVLPATSISVACYHKFLGMLS